MSNFFRFFDDENRQTGELSSAYFVVRYNVISIRFGSVYYLNKCTEQKNAEFQKKKNKRSTQPREESIEVREAFLHSFRFYFNRLD